MAEPTKGALALANRIRATEPGRQGGVVPRASIAEMAAEIDAFAAQRVAEAGAWWPIESAPKQKIILLWAITSTDPFNWKMATGDCTINFDGELEWRWDGYRLNPWDTKPTHWLPLPPPPGSEP